MESHELDLLDEIQDLDTVRKIQDDYTLVMFDPATRLLLDFSVKLTLDIKNMNKNDIDDLREKGFVDEDILDAVHLISYFNFVNRVLDALGAEPEVGMRFENEECISKRNSDAIPSIDSGGFPMGA